jgi:hypothetical protein
MSKQLIIYPLVWNGDVLKNRSGWTQGLVFPTRRGYFAVADSLKPKRFRYRKAAKRWVLATATAALWRKEGKPR